MARRTGFLATVTLVAALGALGSLAPAPGAAESSTAAEPAGPGTAAEATSRAVDPAAAAAAVQRRAGDRYGGYWVDDDGVVHVNVVEPTATDRQLARDQVRIHDAELSYDELVAARDAVAASLDRERTGNYTVGLDVPDNGLTVETERGDAAATRMLALAAARPAVVPHRGTDGPGGGISLERLNVLTGSQIGIVPLGATNAAAPAGPDPTDFPPYEAGLHLRVQSAGATIRCTSGFAFTGALGTFGSTAGHCGRTGDTVRVEDAVVGRVARNTFESGGSPIQADTALYPLAAGAAGDALVHGRATHREVAGSLPDSRIGMGMRLCFDGRASGVGACGSVDAVGRQVCCDAEGRSFVFTCIDRTARAGDSGGPVYQPVGGQDVRAAGTLSSSVTVDGRPSMCFSTIDQIERATGTQLAG